MNDLLRDAYELLNLPEDSSPEDVERAYRGIVGSRKAGGYRGRWGEIKDVDAAYRLIMDRLSPEASVPSSVRTRNEERGPAKEDSEPSPNLREPFFSSGERVGLASFCGRAALFAATFFWSGVFIFSPIDDDSLGRSYMHLINLPFHEAGHIIFSFLGDFMRVLGGTFMQVLVPLMCVAAFLKKGDPFGASFALWWMGQSFIDAAPYIYDARAGELMLLGGATGQDAPDFHDWHNILGRLNLLSYDHAIAYLSKGTGVFFMAASFLWGGYTLVLQCRTGFLKRGNNNNTAPSKKGCKI